METVKKETKILKWKSQPTQDSEQGNSKDPIQSSESIEDGELEEGSNDQSHLS